MRVTASSIRLYYAIFFLVVMEPALSFSLSSYSVLWPMALFLFFIQVAVTRDGIAMLTASNRLLLELKNQQQQLLTVGQYGILLTLLLDSFPSTEKCLRYN